ncbi:YfhO family protein [Saccharothrix sp. ALI-22-I]|uniref:YfhO family protein n=1 Tax=Saccharothrix sp. ALI-22-I TaxID=1933778 RepID=UPI00117B6906|nr:YfhO family protein [Saccharothrix sp. ALI-22-I]
MKGADPGGIAGSAGPGPDVPPGEHVLRLSFTEPGLRIGAWAVVLGIAATLGHTAVWWWLRRRRGVRDAW